MKTAPPNVLRFLLELNVLPGPGQVFVPGPEAPPSAAVPRAPNRTVRLLGHLAFLVGLSHRLGR